MSSRRIRGRDVSYDEEGPTDRRELFEQEAESSGLDTDRSAANHVNSSDQEEVVLSDSEDDIQVSNSDADGDDISDDEDIQDSSAENRDPQNLEDKSVRRKNSDDILPPDLLLRKSRKKASVYRKKGKNDAEIRELVRCVILERLVEGEGHWKLAKSHVKLASAYLDLKGYSAQAIYHTELAQEMMMQHLRIGDHPEHRADITEMLIEMQYTLGRALAAENKLSEAEQALAKAEKFSDDFSKIQTVTDEEVDEWVIKICQALGRLSLKQDKHAVAQTYFDKTLKLMIRKYGKDSVELIPIYQNLGRVEQSKGKLADHTKAIEYYLQAHSISASNYDADMVEFADTAYALALAYSAVGDMDADNSAEGYLREVVTVYERSYGSDNKKVLEVQDELARLLIRTERLDEGISLLRSTIKNKQEVYGDLSQPVAESWKLIGSSHLSMGESEKALQSLKKCYNIECAVYGKNHRKSKDTQRTMDLLTANYNTASQKDNKNKSSVNNRPRFNGVVKPSTAVGGFKSQLY